MFPLALDVSIADGAVTSSGTVMLRAPSAEPTWVAVGHQDADWDALRELPAVLSGDYEIAFDAWWAREHDAFPDAEDWLMEGVFVIPYGTLATLELDIEVLFENSEVSSAGALWRGDAVYAD